MRTIKLFLILIPCFGLLLLTGFLGGFIFYATQNAPNISPTPTPVNLSSDRLFDLIQKWRVDNNLKPYIQSDKLCDFARIRIPEIKKDFSHNGFFKHNNLFAHQGLAENLAFGYSTEEETLFRWLNSPKHLEGLQANYSYSCVITEGSYAIQIFANFSSGQSLNSTNNSSDSIVNCNTKHNGVLKIKKSECDTTVECQLKDVWVITHSMIECDKVQEDLKQSLSQAQNSNTNTQPQTFVPIIAQITPIPTFVFTQKVLPTYPPFPTIQPLNLDFNIQWHSNTKNPTVPMGFHNN